MKLHSLKITGFRRVKKTQIIFGDATFLIGSNNAGKSTIFKAIDLLLSGKKQIQSQEYYSIVDDETGETKPAVDTIILEAEFRNLPVEANSWRGFKGRVYNYETENDDDTGLSVTYKKTYTLGTDVKIEFRSKEREIAEQFSTCKKPQDYIELGIDQELILSLFPDATNNIGKSKAALAKLEELDEIWNLLEDETWFQNPGGIPGNVLKMLPRFLLIPADTAINEIEGKNSGVLGQTLTELFEDVRESSDNYNKAQQYLNKLAKELDPEDQGSEFGKMLSELNTILANVFPDTKIHATTDLSDPNKALKPTFDIEMSSNVRTPVSYQGTGMVRAAAFGMLRFRQKWVSKREDKHTRALIVCFEEPEIYLHPSAANQMRETIYELSGTESQIIATTHSPFLIDLSRKPKQVLNSMFIVENEVKCNPFNVTEAYKKLETTDKQYVKMLLKIDDYMARIFFTNNVVIIEGDTEDILIRETLKKLSKKERLAIVSNFEVVKARGKATIIGLSKYLISMGIVPTIVHDRDQGIEGAEKFNQPISDTLNGKGKIIQLHENVEDVIGYQAPSSEKPFRAYKETLKWETWDQVPQAWKDTMKDIFGEYIEN